MRQSQYLTDHATTDDLLHYEDFQAVLYSVITKAETPLTIGVFGPWGRGKTRLMRMVRRQLEQEKLDSRRTVWFTAWKYDRQDALWRSFILRVLDALYPREIERKGVPREERPILQNPTEPIGANGGGHRVCFVVLDWLARSGLIGCKTAACPT